MRKEIIRWWWWVKLEFYLYHSNLVKRGVTLLLVTRAGSDYYASRIIANASPYIGRQISGIEFSGVGEVEGIRQSSFVFPCRPNFWKKISFHSEFLQAGLKWINKIKKTYTQMNPVILEVIKSSSAEEAELMASKWCSSCMPIMKTMITY